MTEQPLDTAKIEEAIVKLRDVVHDVTVNDEIMLWGAAYRDALDLLVRVAEIYVELARNEFEEGCWIAEIECGVVPTDRRRNPYVVQPNATIPSDRDDS